MIRVGFVDKYLHNWHSDHYPEYLQLASRLYGIDAKVTAAWAEQDHPQGGLTTDQWCQWQGIDWAGSYQDLIDSVDAIMVICADDCLPHEELAQLALRSGKPVYCDKTFAPSYEAAGRMFRLAGEHGTPLITCSAQRYCMELLGYLDSRRSGTHFCATTGPGDMVNYSIHQFEMIQHIMGVGAARCKAFASKGSRHIVYEYSDGRLATFTQSPKALFTLLVSDGQDTGRSITVSDYYMNFMNLLLKFFVDGKPPVAAADTMEIMGMQQAGRLALLQTDTWVELPPRLSF